MIMSEVAYIKPIEDKIIIGDVSEINIEASKFNTLQLRKPVDNIIEVVINGEISFPESIPSNQAQLFQIYTISWRFQGASFL